MAENAENGAERLFPSDESVGTCWLLEQKDEQIECHASSNRRMYLSSASLTSSISDGCISRITERLQTNYANQIEYQLDLWLQSQMSQC